MEWAVPLATGLLGANSSKKGTQTTQQQSMDPRMDAYVYGPDGQSGLLGSAFGLMQKQMETGGLNDIQRQGMDMQRQFLMSPQYQQGYGNMMGLGQSLMGGGIAGNPFNQGMSFVRDGASNMPMFSYTGNTNAQLPDYSSAKPQMVQPVPTQAPQTGQSIQGRTGDGQINFGGGGESTPGGQGISNAGIDAALKAMAISENPAIRALFPQLAALLGLGGRIGADSQINSLTAAGDKLGSIGTPTNPGTGGLLGMGTISDVDGNVRSISNQEMIDAADMAMFGTMGDRTGGNKDGGFGGRNGFAGNTRDGNFGRGINGGYNA
jgi:hypothetical protein